MHKLLKIGLLSVLLLSLCTESYAQSNKVLSTHTIYAEAGGLGGLYSLNYDKLFNWPGKRLKFAIGIGGAYLSKPYIRFNMYNGQHERIMIKDKLFCIRTALVYGKPPIFYGIGLALLDDSYLITPERYDGPWWDDEDTFIPYFQLRYQPQTGGLFYAFNLNVTLNRWYRYLVRPYWDSKMLNGYSQLTKDYVWPGLCVGYTFRGQQARHIKKSR